MTVNLLLLLDFMDLKLWWPLWLASGNCNTDSSFTCIILSYSRTIYCYLFNIYLKATNSTFEQHTWDICAGFSDTSILAVDDVESSALDPSAIPHLTLTSVFPVMLDSTCAVAIFVLLSVLTSGEYNTRKGFPQNWGDCTKHHDSYTLSTLWIQTPSTTFKLKWAL